MEVFAEPVGEAADDVLDQLPAPWAGGEDAAGEAKARVPAAKSLAGAARGVGIDVGESLIHHPGDQGGFPEA